MKTGGGMTAGLAGAVMLLFPAMALAQSGSTPGSAQPDSGGVPAQQLPDQRSGTTQDSPAAGSPGTDTTEPLSDRLSRSGGVIQPPATRDTGMVKPAPETESRMPVIPPPANPAPVAPGGDAGTPK